MAAGTPLAGSAGYVPLARARPLARSGRGVARRCGRRTGATQRLPQRLPHRSPHLGRGGGLPARRCRRRPPAAPAAVAGRRGGGRLPGADLLRRPQRQRRRTHVVGRRGADRRLAAARHLLQPQPPRGLPGDCPGAGLRLGLVGDAARPRPAGARPAGAVARAARPRLADPLCRAHLHRLARWVARGAGGHPGPRSATGDGAAALGAGDAGGGSRHRRDRDGHRLGPASGARAHARLHPVRRQPGGAAAGMVGDAGAVEELPDRRHGSRYVS